jgi:hypothetical protein
MNEDAARAVSYIRTHRPSTVCLLGHSRGAVVASMIAARIHRDRAWTVKPTVYMWLLDIVAHTDVGGPPPLDEAETLTAYPSVSQLVRIVMEDDSSLIHDDVLRAFPLEDYWISNDVIRVADYVHERKVLNVHPRVELVRMPGTHGTGTQVNPMAKSGEALPRGTIDRVRDRDPAKPGELWPIGEACLVDALYRMRDWQVPLTVDGTRFAGEIAPSQPNLLAAYSQVLMANRRRDRAILCNDVGRSRAGAIQEYAFRTGTRSTSRLGRYGRDLRANPLVVNEQHLGLLKAVDAELADTILAAGARRDRRLVPISSDDSHLRSALRSLHDDHPVAYAALVLANVSIGEPRVPLQDLELV